MIENTISIDSTNVSDNTITDSMPETKVHDENDCVKEEAFSESCEEQDKAEASEAEKTDLPADRQEQTVELTVYGKKVQVPLSQAVSYAQKGMAFDHIKNQLANAKNDYRLKALEDMAKQSGKSTYQLLGDLKHQSAAADLIARYGSINDAPTEELGQVINTLEACRRSLAQSETQTDHDKWSEQIEELFLANPGCTEIPQEVIAAAKNGENLSLAYSRHYGNRLTKEIEEAQRELEILKNESKAAKNSTPSAKNKQAASKPKENNILNFMKSTW